MTFDKFTIKAQNRVLAPAVSSQPRSMSVNEGGDAVFSVTASGTAPLLCQWQVDKGDGKGWTDIVGATGSSYSVEKATEEQDGWLFRCVIANSSGKTESNAATLSVKEELGDVTADEAPAKSHNAGKIVLFSVLGLAVVGLAGGLVYYLRRRNDFDE